MPQWEERGESVEKPGVNLQKNKCVCSWHRIRVQLCALVLHEITHFVWVPDLPAGKRGSHENRSVWNADDSSMINSQWIVLFMCKQSAVLLIASVSLIRHGSLLVHCEQRCTDCTCTHTHAHQAQHINIDNDIIAIVVIIIVANIVHASCYQHANKSATSHNNLSNNEIIYLKCNWTLWCSRTYATCNRTSIKSNVYRTHAHTHCVNSRLILCRCCCRYYCKLFIQWSVHLKFIH